MDRSWSRKVMMMLLLGAFLALGMGLSAVRAGDMPVPDCDPGAGMALASDMETSDGVGCDACGDGGAAAASCPLPCPASTLALLPPAGLSRAIDIVVPAAAAGSPVQGAAFAPDPHPPRLIG